MDATRKIEKTIMVCPECHNEIDISMEPDSDGFFVCPVCSKKLKFSKNHEGNSDLPEDAAPSHNKGVHPSEDATPFDFDEELFLCGIIGVSIGAFSPSISLWQAFVGAFLTTFFGVNLQSRHYRRYIQACKKLGIKENPSLYWLLTISKNSLFILLVLAIMKGI